jgi:predicted AAA+ superfamily ATPase
VEKNNTHLSGKYFVAAELYKRGFSVAMTIGNAKSIDILAQKNDRNIAIQVKALYKKNCFDLPALKVKPDDFYILVILNDIEKYPDYYISKETEIITERKKYYGASLGTNRETINYGAIKGHKNMWGKLDH